MEFTHLRNNKDKQHLSLSPLSRFVALVALSFSLAACQSSSSSSSSSTRGARGRAATTFYGIRSMNRRVLKHALDVAREQRRRVEEMLNAEDGRSWTYW